MKRVRLGRTGLQVSKICLGTMTFGNQCDEKASHAILDRALELGISFLDTANVYPATGPEAVGETERIMGTWMKGHRDDVVVATKFWGPVGPEAWQRGGSRRHIMSAVEDSLRRLGTDYIDLYQIHFPDAQTPIEETLQAMDDLVRSGKVHYIGCSNFKAWRLAQALGKSEAHSLARFDCVQPRYNLLFRQFERDLFELCDDEDIAVIPYNPLAGGLLTGKHKREAPEEGSRFTLGQQGERYLERYWHDREHDVVDAIRPLADQAGISMAHLATGWVLANPVVTAPIIGASRAAQLDDAVAAVEKPLDADLVEALNQLTRDFRNGDAER